MSIKIELQATIADLVVKGKGNLAADSARIRIFATKNSSQNRTSTQAVHHSPIMPVVVRSSNAADM